MFQYIIYTYIYIYIDLVLYTSTNSFCGMYSSLSQQTTLTNFGEWFAEKRTEMLGDEMKKLVGVRVNEQVLVIAMGLAYGMKEQVGPSDPCVL